MSARPARLALAPALAAGAGSSEWGVRLGVEAPIATHVNQGSSYTVADTFQTALDLPLVGGDDGGTFGVQQYSLGAGLEARF